MKKSLIVFIAITLAYGYYGCKCKELDVPHYISKINPPVRVLGEDVVYAERQVYDLKFQQTITVQLKMDIVCHIDDQSDAAPRPLIIFFHGYNPITYFKHADESYKYYKQDAHEQLMLEFARKHHCVVALVDYVPSTLKWEDVAIDFKKNETCKSGKKEIFPLIDSLEESRNWYFMISQGKDAIRFLKSKHSEYNIDINNITLVGFSAGGALAAGAGFINDPAFRPAYSLEQPAVTYNANNPYPADWVDFVNTGLSLVGKFQTCKSYAKMTSTFPNPIRRIDLGNIEGSNTTSYSSSVKNVALLCTGLLSSISLQANGPRLFVFGHNEDPELLKLRNEAAVSCSNTNPISIFSEIKTKAVAAGYTENANLKVVQSNNNNHNYSGTGTLAGSYLNVVEAIWAFIK